MIPSTARLALTLQFYFYPLGLKVREDVAAIVAQTLDFVAR